MADVSATAPIFSRGSTVLDYWLAHAEGMTVQPLGVRVEEVVAVAPIGRAESLIVRSRMTHRRKAIPAESIAAVEPASGNLLLDASESGGGLRIPRLSPDWLAVAHAGAGMMGRRAVSMGRGAVRMGQGAVRMGQSTGTRAAGAARRTRAGTGSALLWLRPRAAQTGTTVARHSRSAGARTAMGVAWLAPRVAASARTLWVTVWWLLFATAWIVERGGVRAGRALERGAIAAAERGGASLEARRARRQRSLGD